MTLKELMDVHTQQDRIQRLEKENEYLRQLNGIQSRESQEFDADNAEMFDIVHKNHNRRDRS